MTSFDKSTKDVSEEQETMIARYLGWSRVSGSGARPGHPGDIKSDEWLGECKTHMVPGKPIKFDFDVWQKISNEAVSQFKKPALFSDDGMRDIDSTWVMFKPDNIHKFTVGIVECSNENAYYASASKLEEYYEDSPYIWLVLKHGKDLYAVMPLSEFKVYLDR